MHQIISRKCNLQGLALKPMFCFCYGKFVFDLSTPFSSLHLSASPTHSQGALWDAFRCYSRPRLLKQHQSIENNHRNMAARDGFKGRFPFKQILQPDSDLFSTSLGKPERPKSINEPWGYSIPSGWDADFFRLLRESEKLF